MVIAHLVVGSLERERLVVLQKPGDHLDSFFETVHPHRRRVIGDARLLVVRAHPARPDAELETSIRK